MHQFRFAITGLCGIAVLAAGACSSSDDAVSPTEATSAGSTSNGNPAVIDDTATMSVSSVQLPMTVTMTSAGTLLCGEALCQCNNGLDDDGDGTIDGFDVECTGGIDDDEETFATGIPGDNRDPKWQDCFFDGNSGHGDDRCRYPTECLTGELAQDDPACAITQSCLDNCFPRTPNGCDCFGCCAVQLPGGGEVHVTLGDSCSLAKIGDEEACPVCVPSDACNNECGECELCPGKTAADLPASCTPTDPPVEEPEDPNPNPDPEPDPEPTCDGGRTVCTELADCPMGEFCSLGCCLTVIK